MATILVVDDHATIRALIAETLDSRRVRVLEAEDGSTALAVARRERPELIFLDWGLPGRSGLEVCRDLRADPRTATAKIVMVTARGGQGDREQALSAGAAEFLAKPFSPVRLLDIVAEALGPGSVA
jgi:CheY-like chemotaxis protein